MESFIDPLDNINKYLLVIKLEDQQGPGETATESWRTIKVQEKTVGQQDWYLNYNTETTSKSVTKIEPVIKDDLNGDGIYNAVQPKTKRISTDTSTTGQTGVALLEDEDGSGGVYLEKGSQLIEIIDINGGSIDFPPVQWGGDKKEQLAYAAEADNNNGPNSSYTL